MVDKIIEIPVSTTVEFKSSTNYIFHILQLNQQFQQNLNTITFMKKDLLHECCVMLH